VRKRRGAALPAAVQDTLARMAVASDNAKRLGVRQSSGALKGATAFRVEEMFGASCRAVVQRRRVTQGSACRATLG
jgi:hypothetical protein